MQLHEGWWGSLPACSTEMGLLLLTPWLGLRGLFGIGAAARVAACCNVSSGNVR